MVRRTRPGSRWYGCRAAGTHQSPIRIKATVRSVRIRSQPLALASPRKPSVPDRVQFMGRRPRGTTAVQVSGLRPRATAPHRCWLTTEAYPPSMPAPRPARRVSLLTGTSRHALSWGGSGTATSIRISGSKPDTFPGSPPRPRKPLWSHPKALLTSNPTSSLIM